MVSEFETKRRPTSATVENKILIVGDEKSPRAIVRNGISLKQPVLDQVSSAVMGIK